MKLLKLTVTVVLVIAAMSIAGPAFGQGRGRSRRLRHSIARARTTSVTDRRIVDSKASEVREKLALGAPEFQRAVGRGRSSIEIGRIFFDRRRQRFLGFGDCLLTFPV